MRCSYRCFASLALALTFTASHASAQEANAAKHYYLSTTDSHKQVDQALELATQQHKRILLDFGSDQCVDCLALNSYLDDAANRAQLEQHFLIVHIDANSKKNRDLIERFGVNLHQGLPVVAVVGDDGHVIQATSKFTHAHTMTTADVTTFLTNWGQQ